MTGTKLEKTHKYLKMSKGEAKEEKVMRHSYESFCTDSGTQSFLNPVVWSF